MGKPRLREGRSWSEITHEQYPLNKPQAVSCGKGRGVGRTLLSWVKLREGAQGHGQDQGEAGQHWGAKCKDTLLSMGASAYLVKSTSFNSVPQMPHLGPIPGPLPLSLPQPGSFWKEGFGSCLPTLMTA